MKPSRPFAVLFDLDGTLIDSIGLLTRLAMQSPEHQAMLERACTRVLRLKDRMGLLNGL